MQERCPAENPIINWDSNLVLVASSKVWMLLAMHAANAGESLILGSEFDAHGDALVL